MSKLLKEIYWLNNEEDFFTLDENVVLSKATAVFTESEEILTKELSGENLKTFFKSLNAVSEIDANISVDNFVTGMRVGSQLALELLGRT